MTNLINYFSNNIGTLLINIISTLVCFIVAFLFVSSQKIKISKKILIGVNEKDNKEKRLAWKFKIVNKSIFTSFVNFNISLVGINYIKTNDGVNTQHRDNIEIIAGVRELKRNIPYPILKLIRFFKDDDSNISFAYRPICLNNLNELFERYEEFELNVLCIDSLIGKPHSFTHVYRKSHNPIERGDFSNDGRLNEVVELKEVEKEFIEKRLDLNNKIKEL